MKVKNKFKRISLSFFSISISIFILLINFSKITVSAKENKLIMTEYLPVITEEKDQSGFIHPGVGLTKDILETMRDGVRNKKEPWNTYFNQMLASSSAAITVKSKNASSLDPTKPDILAFDSQSMETRFIDDALKAYTQAILYYITGNEAYRANSMSIIRIWSQMDPNKYKYYTDACIHAGIPLNRMVTAAEILRYSSNKIESLKWTDKDTKDFTTNLINPTTEIFLHDNNHFMNQHLYPLLGAMAGHIFTGNKDRYYEGVEWFTVNKTALDQGQNGSIKQLFRLVDTNIVTGEKLSNPVVQHAEMGRDQAHGSGDLTNTAILSRLLIAQGTKVDQNEGTVSTNSNSVGIYEFLDSRILKAVNYFWKYMLGYDTSWIPLAAHTDASGKPTIIYNRLSDSYRGRMNTAQFWDIYYYYKYIAKIDISKEAPYFDEAFKKRIPSNYYYQGKMMQAWDSVDGGGDFWLYTPKSIDDGEKILPKDNDSEVLVQLEDRYTSFDKNSTTKTEDGVSFIEVKATKEGSKFAPLNLSYPDRSKPSLIGLRFKTNGIANLEISKEKNSAAYVNLTLPNTNGEWKYITYDMNIKNVSFGQLDKDYSIQYFNIKGNNTIVDIDNINIKTNEKDSSLTVPVFNLGQKDLNIVTYAGATTPISLDFSLKDSNGKIVNYQIDNKPSGSNLDVSSGAFSWNPSQKGSYSFVVSASYGSTVSSKNVNVLVEADRKSAVSQIKSSYDENKKYELDSLNKYKKAYDLIMNIIDKSTDTDFYKGLSDFKNATDNLKLLTPLLDDGSINYSDIVTSSAGDYTKTLIDSNNNTYPNTALSPEFYQTFDFGPNFRISVDAFKLQVRMGFPERLAGSAVFGSNDGENWTRLTDELTKFNEDLQTLNVKSEEKNNQYRFIKVHMIEPKPSIDPNIKTDFFEMSEFRILGKRYELMSKFSNVSISSPESFTNRIVPKNLVKLSFKAKEEISDVKVNIQGQNANVTTTDNISWVAETNLNTNSKLGKLKFTINYKNKDGSVGEEVDYTTDNSKLIVARGDDVINNIIDRTSLIDSTANRSSDDILKNVKNLFDSNTTTISTLSLGTKSAGGYITFDFKEGYKAALSSLEILPRQDLSFGRVKGMIIEGSNDNNNWTKLTDEPVRGITDWQTLNIKDKSKYRYIRISNQSNWYGNMSELRFHGKIVKVMNENIKLLLFGIALFIILGLVLLKKNKKLKG